MRVLVCGGRDFDDATLLECTLNDIHSATSIRLLIHGAARGADSLGGMWAKLRGIEVLRCPAAWDVYGKAAGPIRNQYMLDVGKPDMVVAFPGGIGTRDMVTRTQKAGVRLVVVNQPTVE